ncbi:MAG: TlpA family protein disulfide reductase [Chitinophagaceae bacterium]|nr:TlpA family protein disulfide reductase [Chitinophagaceae bacterium]
MKKILFVILLLEASLCSEAQLRIGGRVPGIELPGRADDPVKLSSLEGKVVLIDFWASWCGPCRAANPFIQKLYKKYREQGFEVFAVSLDTKKENWLKAVKKDKLTYTQVLDLEGWNSKVAEQFFVDALPTNFLLDRSGKIVAINLEGKELFDAVKQLVQ